MRNILKIANTIKATNRIYLLLGVNILAFCLSVHARDVNSRVDVNTSFLSNADTSISSTLHSTLTSHKHVLYCPQSVDRIYKQNGYKLLWIAPDSVKTHASEAMLMLDCVLQFGLNYADYHPRYLTYEKLNTLTQKFSKQSDGEKAAFDLILTDAMLSYMNHLHYGKFHPDYTARQIDAGISGFDAVATLTDALRQKNLNFIATILTVQPQTKEYKSLQYHLHLLTGLYTGDCYEMPDSTVRKIAVNLERLRWINSTTKTYININIPSHTLTFHHADTVQVFKIIAAVYDPTKPKFNSGFDYFTLTPQNKIYQAFSKALLAKVSKDSSYLENNLATRKLKSDYNSVITKGLMDKYHNPGLIDFHFPGLSRVYLFSGSEQNREKKDLTRLSSEYMVVENAGKLSALLLANDNISETTSHLQKAIKANQIKTYILKNAMPINVTYITCRVSNGVVITYPDGYGLDKTLEMALYSKTQPLAMK